MDDHGNCDCKRCQHKQKAVETVLAQAKAAGLDPDQIKVEVVNGMELIQKAFHQFAVDGEMTDFLFHASVGWIAGTLARHEIDPSNLTNLGETESRKLRGMFQRFVCDVEAMFVSLAKEGDRRALERN